MIDSVPIAVTTMNSILVITERLSILNSPYEFPSCTLPAGILPNNIMHFNSVNHIMKEILAILYSQEACWKNRTRKTGKIQH